ncbi:MAG: hypothetical protein ACJ746_14305 [Bryobacteraceae bacterium]
MPLQFSSFTEPVRAILADIEGSDFPLVLAHSEKGAGFGLEGKSAGDLFPSARYPEEALSGLLLRLGCWEKSHEVSQHLSTVEGSYWHGIAHRLEPDYGNAGYWFRRVGQHPIFPRLHTAADAILAGQSTPWRLKESWDPFLFIRWCEEANEDRGEGKKAIPMAIQKAEWELLFEWCGAKV